MPDRETFDAFADALEQRRRLAQTSALALAARARASGATRAADDAPAAPADVRIPDDRPAIWPEAVALVQGTLRDLSAAEEELRVQNEALFDAQLQMDAYGRRYQQLFELAPAGYVVTDRGGRILEANQAAAILLAHPRNFLIGKSLVHFVVAPERATFDSALDRMRASRGIEEWPVRMIPGAGAEIEVAATVRAVADREGQVRELYWLLRDESARQPDDLL